MINFTEDELKEIQRTFLYGSYPSQLGDNNQPKRRKSIKIKIQKELTLISNNKISNDYWEGTRWN